MSPQPEQIYITYSNKSDRPERCSAGLAHHTAGQDTHTHTQKGLGRHQQYVRAHTHESTLTI